LEGQVPVFISPRSRLAKIYPRVLGIEMYWTLIFVEQTLQRGGGGVGKEMNMPMAGRCSAG
jgi:hypothetical protein